MKLAVNNFSKGLQTDTHPMIQGNDTLSDCLNGTFVTMLGNEIILQNDMGNRRVNNAFLPPGYQPVGIKEYGGVIYIAAYNPITNKSQIGSFPSPLRKINNEINPDLLGNTFRFGEVLSESNTYNYTLKNISKEVKFLNNDVFLIPLTTDIVIHAGDKFVVSADKLSENWEYITNYKNVHYLINGINNTTKAISPKNRMFTISLGILNSQNEFVDITKTLCRWEKNGNKWNIKNYNSSYSDIFKFNDEYFIPDTFNNDSLDETIEDARLIRVRQTIEANTYTYKLIGPLYLKVALNHIETFSFNIYGKIDEKTTTPEPQEELLEETLEGELLEEPVNEELEEESENENLEELQTGELSSEGTASILVEALITYNCPDGINSSLSESDLSTLNGNLDYETFDEGTPDPNIFRIFDFIGSDGEKLVPTKVTYKKSIYNPNNNLYTLRIVKEYNIDYTNNQYNYFIGVLANSQDDNILEENPIYLKGLSVEGTLDLNLLGSGQVSGDIWKFHNTIKKTINQDSEETITGIDIKLLFGLNAYPEIGHTYRNLRFKFENINIPEKTDESISENEHIAKYTYYGPVNTSINIEDPNSPSFLSLIEGQIGLNSVIRGEYNSSNFRNIAGDYIKPRESYKVFVYCDDYDNENNVSVTKQLLDDLELWYISTELFNKFYNKDEIKNFCTVDASSLLPIDKEFIEKMIVKLEPLVSSNSTGQTSTKNITGSLVSKNDNNILFKSTNEEKITLTYDSNIKIKDEELYPSCIKINESSNSKLNLNLNNTKVRFENINSNIDYDNSSQLNNNYIDAIGKNGSIYTTENRYNGDLENLFSLNISNNNNEIDITINHNDLLLGLADTPILTAMAFDHFFNYVKNNFEDLVCYHGLVLNYDKPDKRIIDAPYKKNNKGDFIEKLPDDDKYYDNNEDDSSPYHANYYNPGNGGAPRIMPEDDKNVTYNTIVVKDNRGKTIEDIMNNTSLIENNDNVINMINGKIFSYIFGNYGDNFDLQIHYHTTDILNNPEDPVKGYKYTRVWWKNSNDHKWVLFEDLLEKNDNKVNIVEDGFHTVYNDLNLGSGSITPKEFITFLSSQMKDYIYCIDETYNFMSLEDRFYSILGSQYKYVNEHNINMYLIFEFKALNNSANNNANNSAVLLGKEYGTLKFKFDNSLVSVKEYKVNLKSNDKFYRTIQDLEDRNESELPIYIGTGQIYDNYGNLLKCNRAYYIENENSENKLLIQDNGKVSREILNGKPVLLCNSISKNKEIVYRYDTIGGFDDILRTTIDYLGFPVVNVLDEPQNNV